MLFLFQTTCISHSVYFISFNAQYLRYKGASHDSQIDPGSAPVTCQKFFFGPQVEQPCYGIDRS